jgi:hypothetical protein
VVLPGAGILAPGSYSPKCLEEKFPEVHIHDLAYPRPDRPPHSPLSASVPVQRGLHVVVLDGYAGSWIHRGFIGGRH